LIRALLARGADPNARLTKGPRIGGSSSKATIGATPFVLAAAAPDPNAMRILHEGGADPRARTESGLTPLIVAAGTARGQDFTEEEKRIAFEAVQLAVSLGADVNAANEDGLTALHGASNNGVDAVIQFLFDHGAKLDVKDKYQQTPLSIASGMRLPWIPYGEELGEVIQPATADLLLKLGATPLNTPDYFTPVAEETDAYRINRSQRYQESSQPQ
jgi:ankyrin repeat protein